MLWTGRKAELQALTMFDHDQLFFQYFQRYMFERNVYEETKECD
jgi:hypothetical protein